MLANDHADDGVKRLLALRDSAVAGALWDGDVIRAEVSGVTVATCVKCATISSTWFSLTGTIDGTFDFTLPSGGVCSMTATVGTATVNRYSDAACTTLTHTQSRTMTATLHLHLGAPTLRKIVFHISISSVSLGGDSFAANLFDQVIDPCDFIEGVPLDNLITTPGCYVADWNNTITRFALASGGTVTFSRVCP